MSDIHYSWRPYQPGDEDAINQLYFKVTGRVRSREQWAWQWQQAPAGKGDIWLIEATHLDGRVELIGHHGIMPVRFTCGDQEILFGKTENTMVLPEYRTKILYPRYEMRFAKEYEPRYHALFSTMGPAPAIRQRKALGYSAEQKWCYMEKASGALASLVKVASHPRFVLLQTVLSALLKPSLKQALPDGVRLLTANEARHDAFINDFWSKAKINWGVAPSRAAEDLAWRYWDNPYSAHYAVTLRQPDKGDALVIIEHSAPGVASIQDISASKPDVALLCHAMEQACNIARDCLGCHLVAFNATDDALPEAVLQRWQQSFKEPWVSRIRNSRRAAVASYMPRKLTAKGKGIGMSLSRWNTTLAISEGRR